MPRSKTALSLYKLSIAIWLNDTLLKNMQINDSQSNNVIILNVSALSVAIRHSTHCKQTQNNDTKYYNT
jgi:hypothetical protein